MIARRKSTLLKQLGVAMLLTSGTATVSAEVPQRAGFAPLFGEHMVLQRDRPIGLWGKGEPGTELTVTLAGSTRAVMPDASGGWRALLPALPAGGPHRLSLDDGGGTVQLIDDVLIGDVWLCAGQSNMEYPLARAGGVDRRSLSANPRIRLLSIPHDSHSSPRLEHATAPAWQAADETSIAEFSALCYFFGEDLERTEDVPLGLIQASWGGSRIEPWLSAKGLRRVGGYDEMLELLAVYRLDEAAALRRFGAAWEDWWRGAAGRADRPWADSADALSRWADAPAPMRDWKSWGDPALAAHNGLLWFATTFELTASQARQDAILDLGGIDEVDVTWLNGQLIGSEFGWGTDRSYPLPPGLLRAGLNRVAVGVLSTWGSGGMLGPEERVGLRFASGDRVPPAAGWRYRKVPAEYGLPPRAPWESIAGLTGLFNAMIAPLDGLQLAGMLWYQGESNAGQGERYAALLESLIGDWRAVFGASVPFLIVQLPNFGTPPTVPSESGWAAIRDAQRRVARDDARSGLVVTVDAGENWDLHPSGKRIVGQRAADVARALIRGEGRLVDGFFPRRAYRSGDGVVVEFDPADDTPVVVGDRTPVGFELCGADPGSCVYANARLIGNLVHLDRDAAATATRVRHCWADAPVCNLYGASGLPVGSFETVISD